MHVLLLEAEPRNNPGNNLKCARGLPRANPEKYAGSSAPPARRLFGSVSQEEYHQGSRKGQQPKQDHGVGPDRSHRLEQPPFTRARVGIRKFTSLLREANRCWWGLHSNSTSLFKPGITHRIYYTDVEPKIPIGTRRKRLADVVNLYQNHRRISTL